MKEPVISEKNLIAFIELSDSILINGEECEIKEHEGDLYACREIKNIEKRYVLDMQDMLMGTILDDQMTLKLPDETEIMFLVKHPMQLIEPLFI